MNGGDGVHCQKRIVSLQFTLAIQKEGGASVSPLNPSPPPQPIFTKV